MSSVMKIEQFRPISFQICRNAIDRWKLCYLQTTDREKTSTKLVCECSWRCQRNETQWTWNLNQFSKLFNFHCEMAKQLAQNNHIMWIVCTLLLCHFSFRPFQIHSLSEIWESVQNESMLRIDNWIGVKSIHKIFIKYWKCQLI